MAEYIDRERAYNSVNERINELKSDKEFNIVKEICISGVKKHIASIPPADVVEREKIDAAIEEIKEYSFKHNFEQGEYLGEITAQWEVVKLEHVIKVLEEL